MACASRLKSWRPTPVWSGLTDEWHPTQALADFLAMQEHGNGRLLSEMKLSYPGNGRNNVANSLLVGAAKMGLDFRIAAPAPFFPDPALVDRCREIAWTTGARITVTIFSRKASPSQAGIQATSRNA